MTTREAAERRRMAVKQTIAILRSLPHAARRDAIDKIVTEYIRGELHPRKRAIPLTTEDGK